MNTFFVCFASGASFLLSFLLYFHPLHQNIKANKWLSFFVFTMGCGFISIYLTITQTTTENSFLFKSLNCLQFLLAPSFYISITYFVNPKKVFGKMEWLHFLPFLTYFGAEMMWNYDKESISTFPIFAINENLSFLVRNILPFIAIIYLAKSYNLLAKHKSNLKRIASSINEISLEWLLQFLFILSITIVTWINDALFGLPFLTEATNFVYVVSLFFLAYFSIKQKAIFAFEEKHIKEISEIIEDKSDSDRRLKEGKNVEIPSDGSGIKEKTKRLNVEQMENLGTQLISLMEKDKLFLDNELNLPTVAEKLGISIHEASFLINENTNDNFYNFINKYRVEEAKRLLASPKSMAQLNILGIAYNSGFNSKTTFNTTFKRIVGISPSQYSKEQKSS
jgi:AraC-like DNA-binding protein